jgi:hypothetical protein
MAVRTIAISNTGQILPLPGTRGLLRVPGDGNYYQLLQDVYSKAWIKNGKGCPRSWLKWKNGPYMALPSTVPADGAVIIGDFFPLNKAWQNFWLDAIDFITEFTLVRGWFPFEKLNPTHLNYWWRYATQHSLCLTDKHAATYHGKIIIGGFADHILKINLGNRDMAIKSLTMSQNIVKGIKIKGTKLVCEALNAGAVSRTGKKFLTATPPKIEDVWHRIDLLHRMVESTANKKLSDGSFPQTMFNPIPYGLVFPFMGINGENTIELSRLKPIANGQVFSPYHPLPEGI